MKAALTMDMLATDIADYLVRKGVSHLNEFACSRYRADHIAHSVLELARSLSEKLIIYQVERLLWPNLPSAKYPIYRFNNGKNYHQNSQKMSNRSLTLRRVLRREMRSVDLVELWFNDKFIWPKSVYWGNMTNDHAGLMSR